MDIIPTYKCNMKCPFCFNKDNWNNNKLILDLNLLKDILKKDNHKTIKELAIIGGEPTLLNKEYRLELINICKDYIGTKPDLYTNLLKIPDKEIINNVNLHVSYDPIDRNFQDIVLNNMLKLENNFSINLVITKNLINKYGIDRINDLANRLKKPVLLSTINIIDTLGIESFRPTSEELIKFTINIYNKHNNFIKSSLIRALLKSYEHNKEINHRFDNNVSINPDGRFQTSGLHGVGKIFDDDYYNCLKIYKNEFKISEKCKNCKYDKYCLDLYRVKDNCIDDFKIMETFEAFYNEHIR